MRKTLAALLAVVGLAMGCGSDGSKESTSEDSPTETPSTEAPVSDLVGRWERVLECQEVVNELKQAGLAPLAQYAWLSQTSSNGEGSFRRGSQKPTKAHPCTGAIPRVHSHYFDDTGQFGSLDWLGGQVDEGTYEVTADTVQIGEVNFHYRIVDGDKLFLTPVLTKAMVRDSLARPKAFTDGGWAVSVAFEGHPWKRVPCEGWC